MKTLDLWANQSKIIMEQKNINSDNLSEKFKEIYFPWSPEYGTQKIYNSDRIIQNPLFIVNPQTHHELETILDYVSLHRLTMRICGGRHSTQLISPEVLIDTSSFNKIIHLENRLLLGAGITQHDINTFLYENNSNKKNYYSNFGNFNIWQSNTFTGESNATIEMVGISTVGGFGILKRTFGMIIDYIVSFVITLPPTYNESSKTLKCTKYENADLFWALLGGGANNFGIVSEIEYSLQEVGDVIEYNIEWDINNTKSAIDLWVQNAKTRPSEFNEQFNIYSNSGVIGSSLTGFYVVPENTPRETAVQTIIKNIIHLKGHIILKKTNKFNQLYKELTKKSKFYNYSTVQAVFADTIDSSLIIRSLSEGQRLSGDIGISIELLGGKISSNTAGCFGFRNKDFLINLHSSHNDLIDNQSHESWLNNITREMVKGNSIYLRYPITFMDIPVNNMNYYGNNYYKLKQVKKTYDPLNVLTYSGTL
jgi:hypothetical protein